MMLTVADDEYKDDFEDNKSVCFTCKMSSFNQPSISA